MSLNDWIHSTADRLRHHQRTVRYSQRDPEAEAVEFVLAALAEAGCPATAAVLEEVDRRRAGMVPS